MATYVIRIKDKKQDWHGLQATVEAETLGQAITLARVEFKAAYPELGYRNWDLKGRAADGASQVKPAGYGNWDA